MKTPPRDFAGRYKDDAKRLGRLERGRRAPVPTGAIIIYASTTDIPAGYEACNGALFDRDEYVVLFDTIGTTFGSTSSTNFRVPTLANPGTGMRYIIKT